MPETRAAARWGLLIGIDEYPLLGPRGQLSGCVNDTRLMARVLEERFGFPAANLEVLTDAAATQAGIRAALARLIARVGPDDLVAIHYSGHGSQMTDREDDEPDGLDETIVPHDSGRAPHPNRDLADDEIYDWLRQLGDRTSYVTLIFDCCHSGTVARDAFGEAARWIEPDLRPVAELPPSPIPAGRAVELRAALRDPGPSGWLPLDRHYVLLAGCQDDESSYEYGAGGGGPVHGALTYFLVQELLAAAPGTTWRDLFERVAPRVTAVRPRQHPQCEGARDRELFGVRDLAPLPYVRVESRAGGSVRLSAGAAHGVVPGTRFAVYPAGTRTEVLSPEYRAPRPGAEDRRRSPGTRGPVLGTPDVPRRLGLVEVTAVGAVGCEARIVEETASGAIAAPGRAVEVERPVGAPLTVELAPAPADFEGAADDLRAAIGQSRPLALAEPDGTAEVRVYLISPRTGAGPADPLPQLGAAAEPTWAAVAPDGRLAVPLRRVDATAPADLVATLERRARYLNTLHLRHPDPANPLAGRVAVTLKRRDAGGRWVDAVPDSPGGEIVFRAGERIGLEVVNRYSGPIYASVLDLGLSGAISLLYPAGASELIAAGETLAVGLRPGTEIELYLPDGCPFAADPADTAPAGGVETFKVLITTAPASFEALTQPGYVHDVRRAALTPLEDRLGLALTGARDARPTLPATPRDVWITVERSFRLIPG